MTPHVSNLHAHTPQQAHTNTALLRKLEHIQLYIEDGCKVGGECHENAMRLTAEAIELASQPVPAAPAARLASPWGWPESADRALARHSSAGKEYEFFGDPYALGCFEGETAFALAATADEPADVIHRCKEIALTKLGLADNNPATENLRGWVVGLFESLGDSVVLLTAPQAADSHHSALIEASRDLARHIEAGSFGVGPETTLAACAALDRFQMAVAVKGGADERAL